MKTRTKIFWILWALSILASILILPYVFSAQAETLKQVPAPLPLIILVSIIQGAVIFGIATLGGLILAEKTGFKLPLLTAWIEHKKIRYTKVFWLSAILGLLVGIVIAAIDIFVFQHAVVLNFQLWQGFLACFYGGIAEEIIMRLFLVSLFVFILMKISRRAKTNPVIVWSSIILVSILFGLGHLPITAAVVQITPWVVFRAILLNGIGGVVFGWLYWKKGLESAIISHFFADIILQVIVPILFR